MRITSTRYIILPQKEKNIIIVTSRMLFCLKNILAAELVWGRAGERPSAVGSGRRFVARHRRGANDVTI